MTAVVLIGDMPSTGMLGPAAARRVDASAVPDAASVFIDHMAYLLRDRGAVLVLFPGWRSDPAVRLARLARGALLSDRIATVPLDLPPLALSLVADQLAFVAPYVGPGVLASLAHRLSGEVCAGAWVNSVAHLEHIRTGFGAHVSSYLPGGGFSVSAGAGAGVHRITSAQPIQEIARRPADPVLLLVVQENGDPDWVNESLGPAMGAVSVTAVQPQPLSAGFWGTKKYTEYVAFSGHPRALDATLRSTTCAPCAWCAEPIALPECPFCSMIQPKPAEPPPIQAQADPRQNGWAGAPKAGSGTDPPGDGAADRPRPPAPASPATPPKAEPVDDDRPGRYGSVAFRPVRR